jgi:hypothetical protein
VGGGGAAASFGALRALRINLACGNVPLGACPAWIATTNIGRDLRTTSCSSPRPVLLKAGEKLRLDVGSRTDLLLSDVALGYEQFQMVVPPYYSRNTLHFGADTFIEVEQVPGSVVL